MFYVLIPSPQNASCLSHLEIGLTVAIHAKRFGGALMCKGCASSTEMGRTLSACVVMISTVWGALSAGVVLITTGLCGGV